MIFGASAFFAVPFFFATAYQFFEVYVDCLDGNPNGYTIAYYSFVTLTTLGYGDETPVGICKGISAFEAVVGYVFLGMFTGISTALFAKESETTCQH